jgi:hypothetical protein
MTRSEGVSAPAPYAARCRLIGRLIISAAPGCELLGKQTDHAEVLLAYQLSSQ